MLCSHMAPLNSECLLTNAVRGKLFIVLELPGQPKEMEMSETIIVEGTKPPGFVPKWYNLHRKSI